MQLGNANPNLPLTILPKHLPIAPEICGGDKLRMEIRQMSNFQWTMDPCSVLCHTEDATVLEECYWYLVADFIEARKDLTRYDGMDNVFVLLTVFGGILLSGAFAYFILTD